MANQRTEEAEKTIVYALKESGKIEDGNSVSRVHSFLRHLIKGWRRGSSQRVYLDREIYANCNEFQGQVSFNKPVAFYSFGVQADGRNLSKELTLLKRIREMGSVQDFLASKNTKGEFSEREDKQKEDKPEYLLIETSNVLTSRGEVRTSYYVGKNGGLYSSDEGETPERLRSCAERRQYFIPSVYTDVSGENTRLSLILDALKDESDNVYNISSARDYLDGMEGLLRRIKRDAEQKSASGKPRNERELEHRKGRLISLVFHLAGFASHQIQYGDLETGLRGYRLAKDYVSQIESIEIQGFGR